MAARFCTVTAPYFGQFRTIHRGISAPANRPPVGHGRELDGTDVSARRNVGAVEFTTSTARCSDVTPASNPSD
jgi:hypothetical protein